MAAIREELQLVDNFSASFNTFVKWGERASGSLTEIAEHAAAAQEQLKMAGTSSEIEMLSSKLSLQEQLIEQQGQTTERLIAEHQRLVGLYGEESVKAQKLAQQITMSQIKETELWSAANRTEQAIVRQQIAAEKVTQSAAALKAEEDKAASAAETVANAVEDAEKAGEFAADAQNRHAAEIKRADSAAGKLLSTVRRILVVTGAISLVKGFLGLSDAQSQINAKLNMMTDSMEDAAKLQNDIYLSAMRSRAQYSDTADAITKMYMNAGNAFDSNDELIAFVEALNKQFVIGGATADEQRSAITQLTQAMAAGALRGQDLNSVLASAPGIARNIEKYMGWAAGSIKKYAEEGKVTAEVVKYAMLDSAESINEQFNSMPMTLSQAMTQVRNVVQQQMQDAASAWNDFINSADGQGILSKMISLFSALAQVGTDALAFVGQGALFVANNLDFILPVLAAVAAAFAILKVQALLAAGYSAAGALMSAGAWMLAHLPVLLLVAVLAAAMIAAQQFGVGMQEVGGWVAGVFGMIYAVGYNVFATLWNVIASFAEFFANVFNDPVAAVAHLFADALDAILSMVETVAGAIDALTGSNLQGAVSGFRGKLSGWVDSTFGENAIQIKRMANLDIGATATEWSKYGANLGSKLDNMNLSLSDIAGSFGGFNLGDIPLGSDLDIGKVGSVGNVKNVDGDVRLADEDLKLYRDLAERRYMNQVELKTLAPQISVTIPPGAGKNITAEDVAAKIKRMLIEQMNSQTATAHG